MVVAKQLRVVAAANHYPESGGTLVGVRHWDMAMRQQYHNCKEAYHGNEVQGFLTSKGDFVNREKAWEIAEDAGQILFEESWNTLEDRKILYSENVW